MVKEMAGQIKWEHVLRLMCISLTVLLLSRAATVFKYALSAKYKLLQFVKVSVKNEFAWANAGSDIAISFTSALLAEILVYSDSISTLPDDTVIPSGNKVFICFLLLALFNSFHRRSHKPATGLAWSFYLGYLKKVLPTFDANVNRSKHKDHILPKLFVLVPENCAVYDSLKGVDKRMQFEENLQPHEDDVAATRRRKYIHSCYKIMDTRDEMSKLYYIALEYATPLNTLKDMCKNSKVAFSELERDEQALLFYNTIKDIIENCSEQDTPVIESRVEFVFVPKNANVVDTILEAVQLMERRDSGGPTKK